MGKQILGVLFLLAGLWLAYKNRPIVQAFGFFVVISGSILFLTGIKQEIIEAIENEDSKEIKENKE